MSGLALLLAFAAQSLAAQPPAELPPVAAPDFCTDRPGLETGTCIMPAGILQLETTMAGLATDTTDGIRSRQWTLGASVVRFGLGPASELQLSWTPWTRVTRSGGGAHDSASGIGDARAAYKVRLTRSGGPVAIDLMPVVKLPLARRPLGSRRIEAGLRAPVDLALADRWTLTLTPEVDWNADGDGSGHHPAEAGAAGLGFAVSDRLSAGLAVSAERDADPGGTVHQEVAGLSLAWLARPKLQFDVEADAGIGGVAPALQLIAGLSVRR